MSDLTRYRIRGEMDFSVPADTYPADLVDAEIAKLQAYLAASRREVEQLKNEKQELLSRVDGIPSDRPLGSTASGNEVTRDND